MTKLKSDITKYSPSLGGTKYNDIILELLAIEGPMTCPSVVNYVFTKKLIDKGIIKIKEYPTPKTPAERYYAKKKLNSTFDRRLKALQSAKYVEATVMLKERGKRLITKWGLTFRGYILCHVAMERVRNNWQTCFNHYRSKTPECWRVLHDKLIEYKASNNLHNVVVIEPLQNALKNKLDTIEVDEILPITLESLLVNFNRLLDMAVSGRRSPTRRFWKLKFGSLLNVSKEDKVTFLKFLGDPLVKTKLVEAKTNIIEAQRKKAALFDKLFEELLSRSTEKKS